MEPSHRRFSFIVKASQSGLRLDVVLSESIENCSRSYATQLIQQGTVQVNQRLCKPSYRVRREDSISGYLPEAAPSEFEPEAIDLDILFEDHFLIVINKPPGLVVHPAPGHLSGTLVNGLLHHCPDLAAFGGEIRPGIVHRLDKDTSGVMVVAKQPAVHEHLSGQFQNRTIRKTYLALVQGNVYPSQGEINLPIGRHPTVRKQMSTVSQKTRSAETHYRVREALNGATLLEVGLKTGRTHQIRVHCAAIHHAVIGDPVYGGRNNAVIRRSNGTGKSFAAIVQRQMLHAWRLGFSHPADGEWHQFEAEIPEDMQTLLMHLRKQNDR